MLLDLIGNIDIAAWNLAMLIVQRRCGPHKLAKALAYCVVNVSHIQRLFSPGLPDETLDSPQSLFRGSHIQAEYFAPAVPRADELSVPTMESTHPKNRKPMLLLVDDNKINLQVRESQFFLAS